MESSNKSEVAQLMAYIDAQTESARLALQGLACGTAQHEIINAKMERLGQLQEELTPRVGKERAIQIVIEAMEKMAGE